ncbi:hypothetical protein QM012_005596 [Aureobasidium pullulans]|uniref:Cytochrome P450 n=1 Tax=Aureobasidium pullulans TaxID=5580 RepID=A0ABR0T5Q3_AURPU
MESADIFRHLPSSNTTWLLALLCALTLYMLSMCVYRLLFHPLARFPGPKLAATTKWYEFYYDILKSPGGQFFHKLSQMHDQYGPIVRPNPSEIHIRDPGFFDVLYAANPTKRNKYLPSTEMAALPLGIHGTISHDTHRRRRVAISPMFSKRAVTSAQDLIQPHVHKLVEVFAANVDSLEALNLQTTFLAYTTDVIYDYMFGIKTNYQNNKQEAEAWRQSMEAVAQATPFSKQFPWLNAKLLALPHALFRPLLNRFLPDIAGLLETHSVMMQTVSNYVSEQSKTGLGEIAEEKEKIKPKTLFHAIDRSQLAGDEKNPQRMYQEGLTVLFAGGETGSRLLAHTMFHLLDNPDILEKVKDEIAGVYRSSNGSPEVKMLERLPWFSASIRESLRLRAATTSRLPLISTKDLVYKGWTIPAGTPISMSHPDILHNNDIFPEALKFKPDRWFNATDFQNRMFVPFGKGTRMCIGMEFAYGEMYMSLAAVLNRFELELFDTTWERDVAYSRDCFLGEPSKSSLGIRVKVLIDKAAKRD